MKLNRFSAVITAAFIFVSLPAHAIVIDLQTALSPVTLGGQSSVDIIISDLGNGSAPSVGTYDFDITYNASILGFSGITFGTQLDLFGLGSLQIVDNSNSGLVNIFELSFDFFADLDSLQPQSFTLAQLTFDTLSAGFSDIALSIKALGDSLGDPLISSVNNTTISVNPPDPVPVSEPGILALLIFGLIGIAASRRAFS